MTLVITELTSLGICMAADSAITRLRNGRIYDVDQQGWLKLLKVPKIRAAVSYWGIVGAISPGRFDEFLTRAIADEQSYVDLASFADYLCKRVNASASGRAWPTGEPAGLHVAGYAAWPDGESRPFFYHIHNGHGQYDLYTEPVDRSRQDSPLRVRAVWNGEPRRSFAVHQDFPIMDYDLDSNLATLQRGYTTKNGSFLYYAILWDRMKEAFAFLNMIDGFSIPARPDELGSRKAFVHTQIETIIRLYKASNQPRIVGGSVTSLGIGPTQYVI